jgi:hypothetical protein
MEFSYYDLRICRYAKSRDGAGGICWSGCLRHRQNNPQHDQDHGNFLIADRIPEEKKLRVLILQL